MTQLLLFLPFTKNLAISKPPPTTHNGPMFTVMLRLRHVTKTTICSPYVHKRLHNKSLWQQAFFCCCCFLWLRSKGKKIKFILLTAEDRFALGGHCDKDRPSRMENWFPAIISCRLLSTLGTTLAYTPIIPALTAPLNTWTPFNPFWFCLFSSYVVFIFLHTLSSDLKAQNKEPNHCTAPNNPPVSRSQTHML